MVDFLIKIMGIDSTTGKEENLADFLFANCLPPGAKISTQPTFNNKKNVFYQWGQPKIIFCTHLDTVPPYIPPSADDNYVYGRGSCDAKGQIAAMYEACSQLHAEQQTNFGLLLTAGEELNSYGAKTANELITGCEYLIIGEPTENKLISAAKGNIQIAVTINGKAAHSGYPQAGESAVETLHKFLNGLTALELPEDSMLGKTTYNIGNLVSANAHNVLSDLVTFNLLFRTTFSSHQIIPEKISSLTNDNIKLEFKSSAIPLKFHTVEGFITDIVAYGSDAPYLMNLGKPMLYGPGSILDAHTAHEKIAIAGLEQAVKDLKTIYYKLI